jgi:DsbC/DsbD-like thiol-disulfide interchange protein
MLSFRRIFAPLAAIFCLARPAAAADAFASDWANNLKSSARLIAGAPTEAGVEIKLAPGAITYGRNPGDAGLPPTLSFEGSANLAQARVSFPAPRRIAEAGGGEAFGYDRALVLPIEVDPIEAGKPVALSLKLNYAVCEQICVPAQASLSLALPGAGAPPSPYAPAIAKAKQETPRKVEWQALAASLSATGKDAWRLCLAPQAGPRRDVFIEPPPAWWFDVKRDPSGTAGTDCFSLTLGQKPGDGALPVAARVTITGGEGPVETMITLNSGA